MDTTYKVFGSGQTFLISGTDGCPKLDTTRCTISQGLTSDMGHPRRFDRTTATSGIPA